MVNTSHFYFCITERQPEVKALVQTSKTLSSNSTDNWEQHPQNGGFPVPSAWTGLVDLDKEEFHSIANKESSEISGEHVVIHLRSKEKPVSQAIHVPKDQSTPVLELHGGSAKEEPDGSEVTEDHELSLEPSLTTQSLSLQVQTSSNVLFNFVDSIMRPWKNWKGNADTTVSATSTISSHLKETSEEVYAARVKPVGGFRGPKGRIDNTILEPESMEPSFKPSTAYSEEGLSEQEKEVVLPGPINELKNPSKLQTEPSVSQPTASRGKNTLWFIFLVGQIMSHCYYYPGVVVLLYIMSTLHDRFYDC